MALTAASAANAATNYLGQPICNPVLSHPYLDDRTQAVLDSRGFAVVHAGSYVCPAEAKAAEAATPAPAAAPPVYYVFFDFDKSTIDAKGAETIKTVADEAKRGNVPVVHVTGYTDTVGTAAYNLKLSQRRAAAVAKALAAYGVQSTTQGLGKTNLLVPTADGVREPSNRRAEIKFQ
jgi:OOP family OmpA-OmpF porin